MYLSILCIAIFAIFLILIGALVAYLFQKRNWKKLIGKVGNAIKPIINNVIIYWYVVVLLLTTIFVVVNYKKCIDLHFTASFNGENLVFLFWLAIIVFPFFDSFEGFGISLKKRKADKAATSFQNQYSADIEKAEKAAEQKGENHE